MRLLCGPGVLFPSAFSCATRVSCPSLPLLFSLPFAPCQKGHYFYTNEGKKGNIHETGTSSGFCLGGADLITPTRGRYDLAPSVTGDEQTRSVSDSSRDSARA